MLRLPLCKESSVKGIHLEGLEELRSTDTSENNISEIVKRIATRVDNAWGQREPRCYNHVNRDPNRQLPIRQMRWYY